MAEGVRFVGLDVHKGQMTVSMVRHEQQLALNPGTMASNQFPTWVDKHLNATDPRVLEATNDAWLLVDILRTRVARISVANPAQVKLIASSMVKTDKRDAVTLARLLAADLIPKEWLPPQQVRELRALIQHRRQLTKAHRATINRLRSRCNRQHITVPHANLDCAAARVWWTALSLPADEQLIVQQNLALLDMLNQQWKALDAQLAQLSVRPPWYAWMVRLLPLPGIDLCAGMTILGAIGDIHRFPSDKHLVSYSGLGTRVHSSGQTYRSGGVNQQGRSELRTALVEAAWSAVRHSPLWRQRFEGLAARIGRSKAIIAIARKLLVVIWHVLTKQVADRQADADSVARSFMRWGAYHHLASTSGTPRTVFVRAALDLLGIGQHLEAVRFTGRSCCLPPAQAAAPIQAVSP